MKILAVAPLVPHPPDHGQRLRSWGLLTALSETHDVYLLTWAGPETSAESVAALGEAFAEVAVFPLVEPDLGTSARLARHARFIAGGLPMYVQALREERQVDGPESAGSRAITESLYAWTREGGPFDVVIFEGEDVAAVDVPVEAPKIVHRLNVLSDTIGLLEGGGVAERFLRAFEGRAWKRFDRTAHAGAAAIVATTETSAMRLKAFDSTTPIYVATNGVEMDALPQPPSASTDVAFIGWMAYPPNVDAARWAVQSIWPAVADSMPQATLRLVGREPTAEVAQMAGPTVVVTGEVPTVTGACASVRVGLVPLRAGMGIKNKTLELMAMGRPVVSTAAGAEGIGASPDDGLIVVKGNDAGAMAAEVVALLRDDERADRLGAAARKFVLEHFGWAAVGSDYCKVVEEVVAGNGKVHI